MAASCDTTGDGSTNVVVQWQENFVVAASSVSVSNATNTVIYKVVYKYYLRLQDSKSWLQPPLRLAPWWPLIIAMCALPVAISA